MINSAILTFAPDTHSSSTYFSLAPVPSSSTFPSSIRAFASVLSGGDTTHLSTNPSSYPLLYLPIHLPTHPSIPHIPFRHSSRRPSCTMHHAAHTTQALQARKAPTPTLRHLGIAGRSFVKGISIEILMEWGAVGAVGMHACSRNNRSKQAVSRTILGASSKSVSL